jgi:hypothetical protein
MLATEQYIFDVLCCWAHPHYFFSCGCRAKVLHVLLNFFRTLHILKLQIQDKSRPVRPSDHHRLETVPPAVLGRNAFRRRGQLFGGF